MCAITTDCAVDRFLDWCEDNDLSPNRENLRQYAEDHDWSDRLEDAVWSCL